MEWSRAKANRVLPREHTGHRKHPLPTIQEKMLHKDITRWPTLKSDWLSSLHQRWRSSIQSAKTRPGADCGSDHELIAKFRLKLKKVGKTTRPFRYDLNQIPNDHIVEVTNRFKGLDLIECLKNYGWRFMTLYRRQWSRPSPRKRNVKSKMVVWGGLINSWKNKRSERQRKKGKYIHLKQSSKAQQGEIRMPSSVINAKK